jgi:tetratricopeptide (TPR) repeat protein
MRIFLLSLLLVAFQSQSQELTYRSADSFSYAQYVNKQYSDLIKTGKEAFKAQIDFYYLRMRVGIAYYELQNYENALPHFQKAYEMNPGDSVTQEYLYYSYLFSNQKEEADVLAQHFDKKLQQKIKFTNSKIDFVELGSGLSVIDNYQQNKERDILGRDNIYGETLLQGSILFSSVALQQAVSKRFKIYYGATAYQIQTFGLVQKFEPKPGSTTEFDYRPYSKEFSNNQYQFNLASSYQFKKGWNLSGGITFFNQKVSSLNTKYDPISKKYTFSSTTEPNFFQAYSLTLKKRFKYVEPSIGLTLSNLYSTTQVQSELMVQVYPFGNRNFYLTGGGAYINDNNTTRYVYTQKVGGRFYDKLWFQANFSEGNHLNYISENGLLVFNSADPIKFISNFELHYYYKQLEFVPAFRVHQYSSTYSYYDNSLKSTSVSYQYLTQLLTFTLKWNV